MSADPVTVDHVLAAFDRRTAPTAALAAEADALAGACRAMALRFAAGGRLLALGTGPAAADAAHVVVEFVHPVIVGKRALPALALPDGGTAVGVALFGGPADIALAFAPDGGSPALVDALAEARRLGMLTVALVGPAPLPDVDHVITVPSGDLRVVREAHVTAYHVLWELVHVFLEASSDG